MERLYLVLPCYNEEEILEDTFERLNDKLEQLIIRELISKTSKIVFVDDGSKDQTWQVIKELAEKSERIEGIKLAHNVGHQNALLAGLTEVKVKADYIISLDADLQDDISVIDQFIEKYNAGYDIVYGVRCKRTLDGWMKRGTAQCFYKMMRRLGTEVVYNHSDYRLMSKRAIRGLEQFEEVNLFLRGLIPLIGYPSTIVEYERKERLGGESKYPLNKMISFAIEGVTSFSTKPIRWIALSGLILFGGSIGMSIYFLVIYLLGKAVMGWTTVVISIWAIGGVQLFAIGVIGEYIGKIYLETKHRPRYIVEEFLSNDSKNDKEL